MKLQLHVYGIQLNSGKELVYFDQLIKGGVPSDQRNACKQNLCKVMTIALVTLNKQYTNVEYSPILTEPILSMGYYLKMN